MKKQQHGMKSRMHRKLCLITVIFTMLTGTIWAHPTGWVYFEDPYLWSQDASVWAYMNPPDTQWIFDTNRGVWITLGTDGTKNGWMFFDWPYGHSENRNTWYYFDENSGNGSFGQDSPDVGSRLWIFNFGAGQWELLNSPAPMLCCLPPARDISGTWVGSGSYIDYTCDDNNTLIQNALVNAQFTFVFTAAGNGGANFACFVQILGFTQLAPNQNFFLPVIWGVDPHNYHYLEFAMVVPC
jgi:hypothetical protein